MAGKYDKNIKITVDDKGSLKQKTKDIDKLNKAVDNNTKKSGNLDRNMKGNARMSSNASKNFSKQSQGMQGVLVPAYAEVAARVFALTAAYTALERAADYSILLKGQEAFAASTGKNMAQIAREVQKASGYMLDFQAASTSTALASTAGLTATQITKMTKAARAASVALGRNMTDSMDRLTRGIVKAEPEILDELGVIIRLDVVYKKYAQTINKTTAELSESEKMTARYNAILGQTDGKFGDIATSIPANAFAQLSSSVLDLVRSGGALASNVFGPLVSVLADSKGLLIAIIALIGRNLLRTVFPVFSSMGEKIDSVSNKLGNWSKKMKAALLANESQVDRTKKGWQKLAEAQVKPIQDRMVKMGLTAGKLGGAKFAKAWKDKMRGMDLFGQKNMVKAIRQTIRLGIKSAGGPTAAQTNRATTPGMEGKTIAQMQKLDSVLARLQSTLVQVSKATKGSMASEIIKNISNMSQRFAQMGVGASSAAAGFLNMGRAASSLTHELGFFKTMGIVLSKTKRSSLLNQLEKEAKENNSKKVKEDLQGVIKSITVLGDTSSRTQRLGALMGATLTGAGKALNAVVGIMGSIMMIKWIGQMILGLSNSFGKASEAASGLSSTLEETLKSLGKYAKVGKRADLGATISDSLKRSEFKSNIAEGINEALTGAAAAINAEVIGDAWFGSIIDHVADLFGYGLADSLAESVAKAMTGLASSMDKEQFDNVFVNDTNIRDSLSKTLSPEPIKSTTGAVLAATAAWAGGATAALSYTAATAAGATMAAGAMAAALPLTIAIAGVTGALYLGSKAWTEWNKSGEGMADSIIKTLEQVNDGTISVSRAAEKIESNLSMSRENAIQFYEDITAAAKIYNKLAKTHDTLLKNMAENFKKLSQERANFSKSLVKGGDLKDFATAFKSSIKDIENLKLSSVEKFRALAKEGLFDKDQGNLSSITQKRLDEAQTAVDIADKRLADAKASSKYVGKKKEDNVAIFQKAVNTESKYLSDLQHKTYAQLYGESFKNILKERGLKLSSISDVQLAEVRSQTARALATKLAHGDVEKQYNLELTLATRNEALALEKLKLDRYGTSALEKRAKIEQELLKNQRDKLIGERQFATNTKEENENLDAQVDNLNTKIALADRIALGLAKRFHEIKGTSISLLEVWDAKLKDNGMVEDADYTNDKLQAITTGVNAFSASLDEMSGETNKVAKQLKDMKFMFGKNIFDTAAGKKLYKLWVSLSTKEGKLVKDRKSAIRKELDKIQIEADHISEYSTLVDLRNDLAETEMNVIDAANKRIKDELKLAQQLLAYKKLEVEVDADMQETKFGGTRDMFAAVSTGLTDSLGQALSDVFMQKDQPDDGYTQSERIRLAMAQELSDWGGNFISNSISDMMFGNKGLLAGGLRMLGGDEKGNEWADAIFPKTDAEKRLSALTEIKNMMSRQVDILSKEILSVEITNPEQRQKQLGNSLKNMTVSKGDQTALAEIKKLTEALPSNQRDWFGSRVTQAREGVIHKPTGGLRLVGAEFEDLKLLIAQAQRGSVAGNQDFQTYQAKQQAEAILAKQKEQTSFAGDFFGKMWDDTKDFFSASDEVTEKNTKALDGVILGVGKLNIVPNIVTDGYLRIKKLVNSDAYNNEPVTEKLVVGDEVPKVAEEEKSWWDKILDWNSRLNSEAKQAADAAQKANDISKSGKSHSVHDHHAVPLLEQIRDSFREWITPKDGSLPSAIKDYGKLDNELSADYYNNRKTTGIADPNFGKAKGASMTKFGYGAFDNTPKGTPELLDKIAMIPQVTLAAIGTAGYQIADDGFTEKAFGDWWEQLKAYTETRWNRSEITDSDSAWQEASRQTGDTSVADKLAEMNLKAEVTNTKLETLVANTTKTELEKRSEEAQAYAKAKGEGKGLAVVIKNPEAITAAQGQAGAGESLFGETEGGYAKNASTAAAFKTNEGSEQTAMLAEQGMWNDNENTTFSTNTMQTVGAATNNTLQTGFKDLIYNGKLNTAKLAMSFVQQIGNTIISSVVSGATTAVMSANGNVLRGGFQAFAKGGVVTKPTLGLVGEGKDNEAIVPLPDGRAIPVAMIGKGAATENNTENNINVTINVASDGTTTSSAQASEGSNGPDFNKLGGMMTQVIQQELLNQQRPGGLLSPY